MLTITLHSTDRGGGWSGTLALCKSDEGFAGVVGVGESDTPQQAAVQAVNNYYRYDRALRAEREAQETLSVKKADISMGGFGPIEGSVTIELPRVQYAPPVEGRTIMVTPSVIERALREAVDGSEPVRFKISYTDAQENETVRDITPTSLDGSLLVAYDHTKDDPRTFRIDRISRMERSDA